MTDRNQFYVELGARLRAKREEVGLTQADLAKAVGISRTSLTNIECGRQRMLVDQLALMCAKLGASAGELVPLGTQNVNLSQSKLAQIPVVANFVLSVTRGQS